MQRKVKTLTGYKLLQIIAGNYLCGTIDYQNGQQSYNIRCGNDGVVTRRISIKNDCILTLCEVQVFTNEPFSELSNKF